MKTTKIMIGLLGFGLSVAAFAAPVASVESLLGLNSGVCPTGTMIGCNAACTQGYHPTPVGVMTCKKLCKLNCPH